MNNIYCISGLGADHRLFNNLSVKGHKIVPIAWVPHEEHDTMSSYAMKMAAKIPEANPIILGLSMGGMLATEIAKQMPVRKVFLISSAKTRAELGYRNRFLQWLSSTELIPTPLFHFPNPVVLYLLGAQNAAEKTFLTEIIKDANPVFVKHCIGMLLNWHNDAYPDYIIHIHGTNDKIIYPGNVKPNYWIQGGSHIMIYNRADEVNKIISNCLAG